MKPNPLVSNAQQLENHLTILGSKIRIAIIQYLADESSLRDFGDIDEHLQTLFSESFKLSYHLKKLEEVAYLEKTPTGYDLTRMGRQILPLIKNFSNVVNGKAEIQIRTSKYSFEPFEETIIEQKLIQEAGMKLGEARIIAREARKRLGEAKVLYLTAPLIREYVNAILIEHHMEDYRHKLTRLGLPPYDIELALDSHQFTHPNQLTEYLGRNVWEQFTLLNVLNQNFADLFLSGDIVLADLAHFSLTPMEFITTGQNLISILQNFLHSDQHPYIHEFESLDLFSLDLLDFCNVFAQFFKFIKPFYPAGTVILRFDEFLERFLEQYSAQDLECFWKLGFLCNSSHYHFTLGISFKSNYFIIDPLLHYYYQSLSKSIETYRDFPLLQIHLTKVELKELHETNTYLELSNRLQQLISLVYQHNVNLDQFSKWGHPQSEGIYSNLQVPVVYEDLSGFTPASVLEKISINCLAIYTETNAINAKFYKKLENYVYHVFDYCEKKVELIEKTLMSFPDWISFIDILHLKNPKRVSHKLPGHQQYFLGISLHGINEIVFQQTNLYPKDQKNSRQIGIDILKYVQKLIEKQNSHQKSSIIYSLADVHLHPAIIHPPNYKIEEKMMMRNQEGLSKYTGFQYGFHFAKTPLTLSHLQAIYKDVGKAKLPELSISATFPKDLNPARMDDRLNFLQSMLASGMTRLALYIFPEFWNNGQKEAKVNYSRYLGTISTVDKINQK